MSKLGKREQAAIEAIARYFSAALEMSDGDAPGATLMRAGKRVVIDVATITGKTAKRGDIAKPRLRFDKVVLRLVGDLQAALSQFVPDGEAVVVTVAAPVRLASKTTAELERRIKDVLARRSARAEIKDTINGNQIRVRFVKGVLARASKVIVFVHNPDPHSDILLEIAESLLQHIDATADKHPPKKSPGERWLVLVVERGFPHIETWRQVYDQLAFSTGFKNILMVFDGDRVESLTG